MLWVVFTLQAAAGPPATDIYLADLRTASVGPGRVTVGPPVNITNRPGYDNQPAFLPDGRSILYTSVRDSQAEIYRYDIEQRISTAVTKTRESEYSPTPLPNSVGFSVIRVEADSAQRLWAFDLDGTHARLVLDSIKPVGYHAWGDNHTLILFVLGSPPTLQIADAATPSARGEVLARDIGRSLQRIPNRPSVSFLQRDSVAGASLREVDVRTRRVTELIKTPTGAEFFAWTPDGIVLTAAGSKLYSWDPRGSGGGGGGGGGVSWQELADFAAAGLTNLTRLAVSPKGDRVAIVAVPAKP